MIYVQVIFLLCLASLLMVSLVSLSVLADPMKTDWGRVSMEGSITDTACAIDPGSLEQTIDMAILPISQLVENGVGNGTHLVAYWIVGWLMRIESLIASISRCHLRAVLRTAIILLFTVMLKGLQCKSLMTKAIPLPPGVPSPEINIILLI